LTVLDDVVYHRVDTQDIPARSAFVLVKLDDNGKIYDTVMG